MNDWTELKILAREWHTILLAKADNNPSAIKLLDAAQKITGIKCYPCSSDDPLLLGAEAILDSNGIFYNADVNPQMAAFYQMHEYAHYKLHNKSSICTKEQLDAEASEEDTPLGLARIYMYSPKERTEREANVFAREVLLPSDTLRRKFIDEGEKAWEIAAQIGVPEEMVCHQLSYALLVSDLIIQPEKKDPSEIKPELDDSQRTVAEWTEGPLLVEAGPGTGKTRTLVGRIEFLLKQGVSPTSILALTFSNKAAEEMRSRIAIAAPDASLQIWMGTFHAFGLEVLRKYGSSIGINPDSEVLDPVDAIFLLERNLSSLKLNYYQNLYEPTFFLPYILAAISRAKDELITPYGYMELAKGMLNAATNEEEKLASEKALEVAGVYAFYQEYLERKSLLDFGDLISRCVALLRGNADVKAELNHSYSHVLVDEYQDVNRASGVLLRELADKGNNLWVVGDKRQAIYRFRGAAPINMTLFLEDFQGAKIKPLKINYRSRSAVIKVFSELAKNMRATEGQPLIPWEPYRKEGEGRALLSVSENLDAEVENIAIEINRLNSEGVPFSKQAILCRTHTAMERIAVRLEDIGIPLLYLGDIFEREEIRDLLSLVSIICEGDGRGLVRVARFPEYNIPLEDVLILMEIARKENVAFPKALGLSAKIENISEAGKCGLSLLAEHLKDLHYGKNAWSMLVQYLFNCSKYLEPITKESSLVAKQKRLVIHQFLQFAHGEMGHTSYQKESPLRRFLNYIRRLELLGADRVLRQVPEWASGLDAVRLLTVHASKGLEFVAVFMPQIGKGIFPSRKQPTLCPPPVGMICSKETENHDEEEECLFFVALSRARDHLCLSRAQHYGNRNSNESEILSTISKMLSIKNTKPMTCVPIKHPNEIKGQKTNSSSSTVFDVRDIQTHLKCPKKYFYERKLSLSGRMQSSGYVQFHRCVYMVIGWMIEERSKGNTISESTAIEKLEETWAVSGPKEHPYENIYMENAKAMVSIAVNRFINVCNPLPTPEWEVCLPNGIVQIAPDLLEEVPDPSETNHIQALRFRTGRPTKNESEKDIYGIFQAAVENAFGKKGKMKVLYLSTGETIDINLTPKKRAFRLDKFDSAITEILKGHSFPKPADSRECPRCPHYFICSPAKNA